MRLHPAVSEEEMMEWLLAQARLASTGLTEEQLQEALKPLAESMAAVSAIVLPEEIAPLFPGQEL